ncbi:class II fructose-bisphosphate aldolase [Candidatus Pantoea edessiphila]|uniref:Fructose-bisphosphate aldolase n=1 Tax=Candidatus Pantoea edessiphila TaxID=2044610 RepID=A0A2P5SXK8_9GAMM|nr:class II fructose-bisphosphate aldolase [Candidatus Pantoea edessiphila]MBK4775705.1 class II fructose-bisphosphate aldolase [Pantoea sp. Edef]PPI87065.1 class II fructose-bisphosphate aldolase [Candidatus Pantoea edessiphila]
MSKILDFVNSGVVNGDDLKKIFIIAKKNKFALPAINCINTDSINAVLEVASKVRSPVIIQFSNSGSVFFAGKGLRSRKSQDLAILGCVAAANYVHFISDKYDIPVILHTDHCTKNSLPWIDGLLEVGIEYYYKTGKPLFSSHMIDLSQEPLKENIDICSNYLMQMSKINMTLEIELGCTGGEEDGIDNSHIDCSKLYTSPEDINFAYEKLIKISSNFTIAASFGNVHGVYNKGNVNLTPIILHNAQELISKKYNLPKNTLDFVFHGGSGSSDHEIKESINYGVVKMNIDTDSQWATWKGVLRYYKNNIDYLQSQLGNPEGANIPNKKYYDPRVWLRHTQLSLQSCLQSYFEKLNAVDLL